MKSSKDVTNDSQGRIGFLVSPPLRILGHHMDVFMAVERAPGQSADLPYRGYLMREAPFPPETSSRDFVKSPANVERSVRSSSK